MLAAGYATRLRPLTDTLPKMLLPLAGRPMLDYLADRLDEVEALDEVHVVTNARFASEVEAWASRRRSGRPLRVWNDGTTSNEDRLGAIGDIRFVLGKAGIRGEDLLVVAGDNLFDFDLDEMVGFANAKGGSAICLRDVGDLELAKQYGVVEVDADDRVTHFEEKPDAPRSTLAATAIYLYREADAALVDDYLAEGNSPDQPGRFAAWLSQRAPLYGYRLPGEWLDIGDREQLLEADNRMRVRAGLPTRAEYTVET